MFCENVISLTSQGFLGCFLSPSFKGFYKTLKRKGLLLLLLLLEQSWCTHSVGQNIFSFIAQGSR